MRKILTLSLAAALLAPAAGWAQSDPLPILASPFDAPDEFPESEPDEAEEEAEEAPEGAADVDPADGDGAGAATAAEESGSPVATAHPDDAAAATPLDEPPVEVTSTSEPEAASDATSDNGQTPGAAEGMGRVRSVLKRLFGGEETVPDASSAGPPAAEAEPAPDGAAAGEGAEAPASP